jgi:hypothetical protein
MCGNPLYSSWPEYPVRCTHDQHLPKLIALKEWRSNHFEALQKMIPALSFKAIHERNVMLVPAVLAELLTHLLAQEWMLG